MHGAAVDLAALLPQANGPIQVAFSGASQRLKPLERRIQSHLRLLLLLLLSGQKCFPLHFSQNGEHLRVLVEGEQDVALGIDELPGQRKVLQMLADIGDSGFRVAPRHWKGVGRHIHEFENRFHHRKLFPDVRSEAFAGEGPLAARLKQTFRPLELAHVQLASGQPHAGSLVPWKEPQRLLAITQGARRIVLHDVSGRPVAQGIRLYSHCLGIAAGIPQVNYNILDGHQEAGLHAARVGSHSLGEEPPRERLVPLGLVEERCAQTRFHARLRTAAKDAGGAILSGKVRHGCLGCGHGGLAPALAPLLLRSRFLGRRVLGWLLGRLLGWTSGCGCGCWDLRIRKGRGHVNEEA
mmetsp:Transcript_11158/g.23398  ORF Transcript_11158/g.23398 Transcript_11158/m.23398 type:complete len:352 (-) Transcript_11158:229-1284(-)